MGDEAILPAKERIKTLKRSIRTFEELRDSGMAWPGTTEGTEKAAEKRVQGDRNLSMTKALQ